MNHPERLHCVSYLAPVSEREYTPGAQAVVAIGAAYIALTSATLIVCELYYPWPIGSNVSVLMDVSMKLIVTSFFGAIVLCPLAIVHGVSSRRRVVLGLIAAICFALWPVTWHLRWYDAFGMGV